MSSETQSSEVRETEETPLLPDVEAGPTCSTAKKQTGVCRICLEEDLLERLERPCACAGTVSNAHHDCLQKWVAAKGNKTCEICKQDYAGEFDVPVTPSTARATDRIQFFIPIRSIYINAGGEVHEVHDVFEEDETTDERRRAGVAWCLTFILFTTLMLLLHHSMVMASADSKSAASDDDSPGMEEVGLPMFIFWVFTRMMLIGLPLYMVMRAAQEARRVALQAHLQLMRENPPGWDLLWSPRANRQAELSQLRQSRGPDNV